MPEWKTAIIENPQAVTYYHRSTRLHNEVAQRCSAQFHRTLKQIVRMHIGMRLLQFLHPHLLPDGSACAMVWVWHS